MNRDEQLSRPAALPPEISRVAGVRAVYPREAGGGTWIAGSEMGIAFALLNRNDASDRVTGTGSRVSRGHIIPALLDCATAAEAAKRLRQMDFSRTPPFRLIGLFPAERRLGEWTWNGSQLASTRLGWKDRHWFSSSLGDARATELRARIAGAAHRDGSTRDARWLRRLHRSHGEAPGPFSICVHRPEVGSVSYTELRCTAHEVRCLYLSGPPCQPPQPATEHLLTRTK